MLNYAGGMEKVKGALAKSRKFQLEVGRRFAFGMCKINCTSKNLLYNIAFHEKISR